MWRTVWTSSRNPPQISRSSSGFPVDSDVLVLGAEDGEHRRLVAGLERGDERRDRGLGRVEPGGFRRGDAGRKGEGRRDARVQELSHLNASHRRRRGHRHRRDHRRRPCCCGRDCSRRRRGGRRPRASGTCSIDSGPLPRSGRDAWLAARHAPTGSPPAAAASRRASWRPPAATLPAATAAAWPRGRRRSCASRSSGARHPGRRGRRSACGRRAGCRRAAGRRRARRGRCGRSGSGRRRRC